MRVAIATCAGMPAEFTDDARLEERLRERGVKASRRPWDDPATDWRGFDAVVIRSTWDYSRRREEFLLWVEAVGERLHNAPGLVRWNSDKRYLADLAAAEIPAVETAFVAPGAPLPPIDAEVVVKPTVSAGGRDTGRFGERLGDAARALVRRIHASGRVAMVQPYQGSVDVHGETALVFIGSEPSHALRKRAVLRPDEVAPVREDWVGAAEAMYDPALVGPGEADDDEVELAREVIAHVRARFGEPPLYARVDMVRGSSGAPMVLELEAIEPNLYFDQAPGALERLTDAIVAAAGGS